MSTIQTEPLTLDLTREFNAPRDIVFRAWRDAELLSRWSAPRGFTITAAEGDFRPGGAWRACMRSPSGEELCVGGTYREIVLRERLVFTHEWEEDPEVPQTETLVRIEFADAGKGRTRMHFHQERFKSEESRDGHRGGWEECFDLLEEVLADTSSAVRREIVNTRVIAYPRALVFRAYTEPEHLARWWGPKGFSNTFQKFELRPGGDWHFVMHGPDGTDYQNEWVFREIESPARLAMDHLSPPKFGLRFDFAEQAGGTHITMRQAFETAEVRDAIATYAVECNEQNFDRLEIELARMEALASQPASM